MQTPTRELIYRLDPVLFAEDMLDAPLDPWQRDLLRSQADQILLNCSRQSGKSSMTAAFTTWTALYEDGALILLLSPSLRQSQELFRKCLFFISRLRTGGVSGERNQTNIGTKYRFTHRVTTR